MKYFASFLFVLTVFSIPLFALGQFNNSVPTGGSFQNSLPTASPPPSGYSTLPGQFSVQNPLKAKSIPQFFEQVLQAVITIGIPVAVLFIVFAGFKFVVAMGKPEALAEARRNLINTVIGIGIFLAAWLIAQVIYSTVTRLGA
jgi:hypothetical protein